MLIATMAMAMTITSPLTVRVRMMRRPRVRFAMMGYSDSSLRPTVAHALEMVALTRSAVI